MANGKLTLTSGEEAWHPARLIPVAGIRSEQEQERRATSALLAVMHAVPEFGRALLTDARAPRGRVTTFAEVQLKDGDGRLSIPDGAIVVERGKTRWQALVEVKTAGNPLKEEQVNRYLDMAREHGFDAVITISNDITPRPTELPVAVDRRKTKRIGAYHLSWWRIMTEAILQSRHRGISDPDQAWILAELIHYLDHPKSGAGGFEDMGREWVRVRDGARQGTLRTNAPEVRAICERWMQFIDYLALSVSQELGREVQLSAAGTKHRRAGSMRSCRAWQLGVNSAADSGFPTQSLHSKSLPIFVPVRSQRASRSPPRARAGRRRASTGCSAN